MAVTTLAFDPLPPNLRHPLLGFGAQLNTNLFTPKGETSSLTAGEHSRLLAAIKDVRLGHSRIFVRPQAAKPGVERDALMSTIKLADDAGANVNLTWWQGPFPHEPQRNHEQKRKALMRSFAGIVEEARTSFTCVKHVTVMNEVNSHDIAKALVPLKSMQLYNLLYRDLAEALGAIPDPQDPAKTLRDVTDLVGGDLVAQGPGHLTVKKVQHPYGPSDQNDWLAFMRQHMADVLDAYSIHVYWQPNEFPDRPRKRLDDLAKLGIQKPIYVTEFGVRQLGAKPEPGTFDNTKTGLKMERSIDVAFMHAWFNVLAPQRGCAGIVKWALYATSNKDEFGEWGMIGPRTGLHSPFVPSPICTTTRICNDVIGPGWTADGLSKDAFAPLLASRFKGPGGGQSIVVLNDGANAQQVQVGFAKKNARLSAVDWNADRQGTRRTLTTPASSGPSGLVTVAVPPRGLVALTTLVLD